MIEIGTATDVELNNVGLLFGRTFGDGTGWIAEGLAKGFYRADTISIDGEKQYVLVHHVNDQKILTINAVGQLSSKANNFCALVDAMVLVAQKYACRGIEG